MEATGAKRKGKDMVGMGENGSCGGFDWGMVVRNGRKWKNLGMGLEIVAAK